MQMRMFANMIGGAPVPAWNDLQTQAASYAKTAGRTEEEVMPMVLGNVALQWGLRDMSGMSAAQHELPPDWITEERLTKLLKETLDPAKLRVVTLGPPPETEPRP